MIRVIITFPSFPFGLLHILLQKVVVYHILLLITRFRVLPIDVIVKTELSIGNILIQILLALYSLRSLLQKFIDLIVSLYGGRAGGGARGRGRGGGGGGGGGAGRTGGL